MSFYSGICRCFDLINKRSIQSLDVVCSITRSSKPMPRVFRLSSGQTLLCRKNVPKAWLTSKLCKTKRACEENVWGSSNISTNHRKHFKHSNMYGDRGNYKKKQAQRIRNPRRNNQGIQQHASTWLVCCSFYLCWQIVANSHFESAFGLPRPRAISRLHHVLSRFSNLDIVCSYFRFFDDLGWFL